MAPANPDALRPHATRVIGGSTAAVGVSALGIVLGDIGTSPLYTLKTVLNLTGASRNIDDRRSSPSGCSARL